MYLCVLTKGVLKRAVHILESNDSLKKNDSESSELTP